MNKAELKEKMDKLSQKILMDKSDWFAAQFELDERVRSAMEVIESVHVDEETDECLQLAMYEIIAGAADIAARVTLAKTTSYLAEEALRKHG